MEEEKKILTETPETPEVAEVQEGAPETSAEKTPKKKRSFKAWWQNHKPTKRRLIQLYAALLTNANIKGFKTGRIYAGNTKNVCVPGLNCYSCPGAVGACPLGSLQNALAASGTRAPFYVIGIILLFGLILGRTICGFLCPFGLIQDLVYKIKTPKVRKGRVTRVFSYLKYVILAVFAIAIPVLYGVYAKTAVPAFCKYICPAGTLGGAVALLINPANADLFGMLGGLFTWKFAVMAAVLVVCVFMYRAFCRFLCPLGALYGFFNRFALLGVKLDKNKCTDCGLCVSHCKMDIKRVGDHECINCGECIDVCPAKAISWKGSKLFLHANAVEAVNAETIAAPLEETKPLASLMNAQTVSEVAVAETVPEAIPEAIPEAVETPAAPKKKRGRNFWLQVGAWCAALAVLVGALVYYNFIVKDPVVEYGYEVGDNCYDFDLKAYCGEEDFKLSEHRGKIVIINFWYTTCGPCVTELPEFQRIATQFKDEVEVVAIHSARITEGERTMADVQTWLEAKADVHDPALMWSQYNITFLQDTGEGINGDTYVRLGGRDSYPMTVIVDQDGVIQFTKQGSMTYENLRTQIYLLRLAAEEE